MNTVMNGIVATLSTALLGKQRAIEYLLACLLADGHVLIEDLPGVGKTTLAKAVSRVLALEFGRVQCTPDLMPSDITGNLVLNPASGEFRFRPGPIFKNLLLADEINRSSPKTQSSLLEAMEERQVTVDDTRYPLASPFMVLATQNPVEFQGTFPLPEAQLDRFMIRLTLGYPDPEVEADIAVDRMISPEQLEAACTPADFERLRAAAMELTLAPELVAYAVSVTKATRDSDYLLLGASPRASRDLCRLARGLAFVRGAAYVSPDHIKELAPLALGHRLLLSAEARMEGMTPTRIIGDLLKGCPVPLVDQASVKN